MAAKLLYSNALFAGQGSKKDLEAAKRLGVWNTNYVPKNSEGVVYPTKFEERSWGRDRVNENLTV